MRTTMRSSRRLSPRKSRRGQGTVELLAAIAPMFFILGMIITAGWWTYGRMNAISHTYFITMQIETYNNPSRLSSHDDSWEPVATGRPFWFDVRYTGSKEGIGVTIGMSANYLIKTVYWLRGAVLSIDIDQIDPNAYPFWDNPIVSKYGEPQSTLPGTFCWYCSTDNPDKW